MDLSLSAVVFDSLNEGVGELDASNEDAFVEIFSQREKDVYVVETLKLLIRRQF